MTNMKMIWQEELSELKQTNAVVILGNVGIWEVICCSVKYFTLL